MNSTSSKPSVFPLPGRKLIRHGGPVFVNHAGLDQALFRSSEAQVAHFDEWLDERATPLFRASIEAREGRTVWTDGCLGPECFQRAVQMRRPGASDRPSGLNPYPAATMITNSSAPIGAQPITSTWTTRRYRLSPCLIHTEPRPWRRAPRVFHRPRRPEAMHSKPRERSVRRHPDALHRSRSDGD